MFLKRIIIDIITEGPKIKKKIWREKKFSLYSEIVGNVRILPVNIKHGGFDGFEFSFYLIKEV